MRGYKLLSLDESGKASFSHQSELFILTGVVIPESIKQKIDRNMRKIKKKYFGDEEIIFHGRDIDRHGGIFMTLDDPKLEKEFWSEYISVVNHPDIAFYFVVTNKKNAKKMGWHTSTILKRSYLRILSEFAKNIKNNNMSGKILNESESEEDQFLIFAHNKLQNNGTGDGSVSGFEYKNQITSLCLVNKQNLDVDIQIADTVGIVARLKYQTLNGNEVKLSNSQKLRLRLIDRKIVDAKNPGIFEVLI